MITFFALLIVVVVVGKSVHEILYIVTLTENRDFISALNIDLYIGALLCGRVGVDEIYTSAGFGSGFICAEIGMECGNGYFIHASCKSYFFYFGAVGYVLGEKDMRNRIEVLCLNIDFKFFAGSCPYTRRNTVGETETHFKCIL